MLTRQAGTLVRGVDLVAGLRNRLQLLLDLHAAAALPITQQALSLFVTSICLVKVMRRKVRCCSRQQRAESFFTQKHHGLL